jgi:adenylate cyclase
MSNKPTAEPSSYECVLLANQAFVFDQVAVRRARTCLEATVKRNPAYAHAWAALAGILAEQRWWGTALAPPDADDIDKRANLIPRIVEAGNRAVDLAPESASARLALFLAYYVTCQPARMRIEADRVLAINPNDASALATMGNFLAFSGEWDCGRQLSEKALSLGGPAAPRWWWYATAKSHYHNGEYAKAYEFFLRSYTDEFWLDHLHVVYTLAPLGRIDEARAQIPALLKLKPDMSVREADRVHKMFCFDADYRERMTAALRLAGLREEADDNRAPPKDVAGAK